MQFYPVILFIVIFAGNSQCSLFPCNFWEKTFIQIASIYRFVFNTEEIKPIEKDVTFHLFTRYNLYKPTQLYVGHVNKLERSHFKSHKHTIFVIHGWTDDVNRKTFVNMRNELLKSFDINVIMVDWRRLSAMVYFHAADNIFQVADHVTELIKFLIKHKDLNLDDLHLIGHSLGAQISGNVGRNFNGKIKRITGLDTAGPLFEFWAHRNSDLSLDKSDAQFVDVIHTAGQDFGVMKPIGHVDFYPNDGIAPQPGCVSPLAAISCSHVRAMEFFTESINSTKFQAYPCMSWLHNYVGECGSIPSIPMGIWTPVTAQGTYYITTNSEPPFARG